MVAGADARSRIRTCDLWLRRPALYPLSYARSEPILEGKGYGPAAAWMRVNVPSKRCHTAAALPF
jgi:hypothetical protein